MATTFEQALAIAKAKYPYEINHYEEYKDYFVFEHDTGVETVGGTASPIVIRKADMVALNYEAVFFNFDGSDVGEILADGKL